MTKDDACFPEGTVLYECGEKGRAALAALWTTATYPPKAAIVSESDTDDDVFFVLEGTARAATFTDHGKEVLYSDLPRGCIFGIFAAVDGQPRSTNVFAKTECRVARMSARSFRKVLHEHEAVNLSVMTYLVGLVRNLSNRMTEATTLSTEQRLCAQLLRLCTRTGKNTATIESIPTQQELATIISSQRESVGREMSKLKDQGLILRNGKTLSILDVDGLERKLSDL